ncbi:MAG: DUF5671 domain-containing protein [Minisyncoccota bacterium]
MEPNTQTNSHAKDVFLNLASMVTLYASAVALLNLLFSIINKAYPKISAWYGYNSPSISLPVATLIIIFPLYIFFMWLIEKNLPSAVEIRMSGIRKWLIYITLFISGGLIVGDLVTIVYYFIDGQELTAGFILKVLSILVVAGLVFGYYITDVRDKLSKTIQKSMTVAVSILIIISIIIGFSVIGSPRTQRLVKYDQSKVYDLQNIASQVRYFYETNKVLPASLEELAQSNTYGGFTYTDSQTNKAYVYKIINVNTFEVCAEFNLDTENVANGEKIINDVWNKHGSEEYCFRQITGPQQKEILNQIPVR